MEIKTTKQFLELNSYFSPQDEKEKQQLIKDNPSWVRLDDEKERFEEMKKALLSYFEIATDNNITIAIVKNWLNKYEEEFNGKL